ncbi:hypothetical protein NPIL_357601 [Nephila pilipes]|uniref:Uncharacterized protein n=1 Tax=Nephila pilipes TaxID=299642 RepID=A0A8X6TH97_NEPPI|nr:hypothetical protein NPIL_357601 [Nephila pilipes]
MSHWHSVSLRQRHLKVPSLTFHPCLRVREQSQYFENGIAVPPGRYSDLLFPMANVSFPSGKDKLKDEIGWTESSSHFLYSVISPLKRSREEQPKGKPSVAQNAIGQPNGHCSGPAAMKVVNSGTRSPL